MKEYFIWLAKIITLLVIVLVFVPLLLAATMAATRATEMTGLMDDKKKVVAVVELTGMIDGSKGILKKLHKHMEDDRVEGVVLRINSPGGAVGPAQEIYSAVKKLRKRKPIVASMGAVAASGGLYAALGASKVFCQPGTLTGSIGVILQLPNFSKIVDKIGFEMVTIKSGELKDAGNSFRDMTQRERKFFQDTIDEAYEEFVQAIIDGRGLTREEVMKFADGRILLGSQAKKVKLVDEYGDIYDAARAVYELAGNPLKEDESPNLLFPDSRFSELREFLGAVLKIPKIFQGRMKIHYLMP